MPSAPSMAAELAVTEYAAAEKSIASDFTTAEAACAKMSGNAGEVCVVVAKGKESVAKADLEVKNEPAPDSVSKRWSRERRLTSRKRRNAATT